jgi:type I restriction-modification system DNA methylase subunit
MGIFQKNVWREASLTQNKAKLEKAYKQYTSYFQNEDIQKNIQAAKEEQFQEGFLHKLFVEVLGYTMYPDKNHTLITELKNPNDAKKADAGILIAQKVVAIIELKSTKTGLLDQVEAQAFGYKNQHPYCRYVITSNFQMLRFYLESAYTYEEFDLFTITKEDFSLFYTLLAYENIKKENPVKLKERSLLREQELTSSFYEYYQHFKISLFENVCQYNTNYEKLLLFEKVQKLLDRIVFICFAEDKGLLPANILRILIQEYEQLKELGHYEPLYERLKTHFQYIDKGFSNMSYSIFGFNGGLFSPDKVLDNLVINDNILENNLRWLSRYDFNTDIDLNVLGHIFEHSLSELDQKREEILKGELSKNVKSEKRKKDGVFYTPVFITDFMIAQSLGKMCQEAKTRFGIEDEPNIKNISEYRQWLLQLRILDPSCGSGAFLNQVFTFLLHEHEKIDKIESNLLGKKVKHILGNTILENNIFGVDINAESVEITKLSLWLRAAEEKRQLNNLSGNILRGNSLVSDVKVSELALDWNTLFPDGFDLIIGNPPWGAKIAKEEESKIKEDLKCSRMDSSAYFILAMHKQLKQQGRFAFIVPKSILFYKNWQQARELILAQKLEFLADTGISFSDVNLEAIAFGYKKQNCLSAQSISLFRFLPLRTIEPQKKVKELSALSQDSMQENNVLILTEQSQATQKIIAKIQAKGEFLKKYPHKTFRGLYIPDSDKKKVLGKGDYYFINKVPDVSMYKIKRIYAIDLSESLEKYATKLAQLAVERILIKVLRGNRLHATLAPAQLLSTEKLVNLTVEGMSLHFVLGVLNSKLASFYLQKALFSDSTETSRVMDDYYLAEVPLPNVLKKDQDKIANCVQQILENEKQIQEKIKDFLTLLQADFPFNAPSKKLMRWPLLTWSELQKELTRLKTPIPLRRRGDWLKYFEENQNDLAPLYQQNKSCKAQIDSFLYTHYGLTEEEVKEVEYFFKT